MAVTFNNPVGGASPLGKIIVAAGGTPIKLNTNVGAQGQGSLKFASRFKQLLLDTDPANTGNIYLCWNGFDRTSATGVLAKIPPGTRRAWPDGGILQTTSINVDNFTIDADVDGEATYASVIWG